MLMCLNILRGFRCKMMQCSVLIPLHGGNYSCDLYYLYSHLKISFHVIFVSVFATSCSVIWKSSTWEGNCWLCLEGKNTKESWPHHHSHSTGITWHDWKKRQHLCLYIFFSWLNTKWGKKNKHGGTAWKCEKLLCLNLVAIKKLVAESSWQTGGIDTANRQRQLADKILQKI